MTTIDHPAAPVARNNRRDAPPPSERWNADSFRGAILRLGKLVGVPGQRAAALEFPRQRRALLEA